ncbi:MAG: riboflavin biosynthesis protein RibF [Clostridia bacterium]|nr:riboflavin biosynthesis protein RibF [Clostridia bacterium]
MKVLSLNENESAEITLLLGNFDGLHIGHKVLIDCAKSFRYKLAILTYENLFKNGYINTMEERFLQYEKLGFDYTIVLNYDDVKKYQGTEFLSFLVDKFNIKHIVCGEEFTYGNFSIQGEKDMEDFAFSKNIGCSILPSFSIKNQRMSSSYMKELIKNGNLDMVNKLMLKKYSILSTVVHGNQLGKTLGFPTMNFNMEKQKVELKAGVYLVSTMVDGKEYYGICNFGLKYPHSDQKYFEVHLLDFNQQMYGEKVEIVFLKFIRNHTELDSIEDLKVQLMMDIKKAREIISYEYELD